MDSHCDSETRTLCASSSCGCEELLSDPLASSGTVKQSQQHVTSPHRGNGESTLCGRDAHHQVVIQIEDCNEDEICILQTPVTVSKSDTQACEHRGVVGAAIVANPIIIDDGDDEEQVVDASALPLACGTFMGHDNVRPSAQNNSSAGPAGPRRVSPRRQVPSRANSGVKTDPDSVDTGISIDSPAGCSNHTRPEREPRRGQKSSGKRKCAAGRSLRSSGSRKRAAVDHSVVQLSDCAPHHQSPLLYNPPPLVSAEQIPEEDEVRLEVQDDFDAEFWHRKDESDESDWESSVQVSRGPDVRSSIQNRGGEVEPEEADCFDDTDDDDALTGASCSPETEREAKHSPLSADTTHAKLAQEPRQRVLNRLSSCLPPTILYSYAEGVAVRQRRRLPVDCPHPVSPQYPTFMRDFFLGRVQGCENHDWSAELTKYKAIVKPRQPTSGAAPNLSLWQAAGYVHAQKVMSCPKSKGSIFWWTPGSGKSVMVALLIELMFTEPLEIFVVSTPQNIRENGYEECMRSLLRFSPLFAQSTPPSSADVEGLKRRVKQRKPPIHKRHFLSLRQFENEMKGRCCTGELRNTAVIVDECHELCNQRLCDQQAMWEGDGAILKRLAQGAGNRLFLLSGTPWRDGSEMLRMLNLVSGRSSISVRRAQCPTEDEENLARVEVRSQGRVSFVDGASDRSTFPDNGGLRVERCTMQTEQMHNFDGRCRQQLRQRGLRNLCQLAERLNAADTNERRELLCATRLIQVAGGVFWGSERGSGLCHELQHPETATLTSVQKFSAKFASVIRNILQPDDDKAQALGALRTRHFVYSVSDRTITQLSATLCKLHGEAHRFRQLCPGELEWTDGSQQAVRLRRALSAEESDVIFFVVIRGSAEESKKLKAAFGFVTSDGRRFEGIHRSSGAPLVQVLLGSHETNQGLTFLRLQRIHLLEPNPLGWGKVVQTMGRGIRRGTHVHCEYADVADRAFRRVETIVYTTVLDPAFLDREQQAQSEELNRQREEVAAAYAASCREMRGQERAQRIAADPSETFTEKVQRRQLKIRNAMRKMEAAHDKLTNEQDKVREGWLRVEVPGRRLKRTGEPKRVLVQTFRVLVDEAVLGVTWREHQARARFDEAVRSRAVDRALLFDFHAAQHKAEPSINVTGEWELAGKQHVHVSPDVGKHTSEEGARERAEVEPGRCLVCCAETAAGTRCSEGHFECATCTKILRCGRAAPGSERLCAEDTCFGFCTELEKELRKFPPYWSHQDEDGVHLVRVADEAMLDRFRALVEASIRPECRAGTVCPYYDVKAWGEITKVLRIENGPLWCDYCEKKVEFTEAAKTQGTDSIPVQTEPWQHIFEDVVLKREVNECLLFHGTQEHAAKTIAQQGFELKYANPNGFYGAGIYAADSACKSASYADNGTMVLLLCRVLMGPKPYRTKTKHQGQRQPPADYDAVFAEHGVARSGAQVHNEFVVYDSTQILPEYLVYFTQSS